MAHAGFERLEARVAVLPFDNIDTDQILPADYMKGLTRDGLGVHLFERLRRDADGALLADFPLNRPGADEAGILVAGANFGCGSSREHAVWALKDHGIRAILAHSFGMIFAANCARNSLLLVALDEAGLQRAMAADGERMEIDLLAQRIRLADGETLSFAVDPQLRERLLDGLDDIERTLRHADAIAAYEAGVAAACATGAPA